MFLYCRISFILPMISTKNDSAVAIKISPKKIFIHLQISLIMKQNMLLIDKNLWVSKSNQTKMSIKSALYLHQKFANRAWFGFVKLWCWYCSLNLSQITPLEEAVPAYFFHLSQIALKCAFSAPLQNIGKNYKYIAKKGLP